MPAHNLTKVPVAIGGLIIGTPYSVQNQSPRIVILHAGAAVPDADEDDTRIMARMSDDFIPEEMVTLEAGETLYAWVLDNTGKIVVNKSA